MTGVRQSGACWQGIHVINIVINSVIMIVINVVISIVIDVVIDIVTNIVINIVINIINQYCSMLDKQSPRALMMQTSHCAQACLDLAPEAENKNSVSNFINNSVYKKTNLKTCFCAVSKLQSLHPNSELHFSFGCT